MIICFFAVSNAFACEIKNEGGVILVESVKFCVLVIHNCDLLEILIFVSELLVKN